MGGLLQIKKLYLIRRSVSIPGHIVIFIHPDIIHVKRASQLKDQTKDWKSIAFEPTSEDPTTMVGILKS